jgi:uncharacterized protein (DUF427 family)
MTIRVADLLLDALDDLRVEPTDKRVRATPGGRTVIDSEQPLLVWEPLRLLPTYAVPEADVHADLDPGEPLLPVPQRAPQMGDRTVLDRSVPFAVHTTAGEPLAARAGDAVAGAFRAADPALAGHLIVEFAAFDGWWEEDEPVATTHPRDPFHRIDILASRRGARVSAGNVLLADSTRPTLLLETLLPTRAYLPPADVRWERLAPSPTTSVCAYKGEATYWAHNGVDVAWSYPKPRPEAGAIASLVCFFDERVDVALGGRPAERPQTLWSI